MRRIIISLMVISSVLGVRAGAEPVLEGQVRLSSGAPAVGVQVRLFDLADLRQSVGATTDEAGYFALPLRALPGLPLPSGFELGPNYPNPFNPSTIIPYQLPSLTSVRLEVFNVLGQRIATLVDGERSGGFHTAVWNGTDGVGQAVGAGVYIYRLSSGDQAVSRRMVLVDGQAGIASAASSGGWPAADGAATEEVGVYGLTVSGAGLVPYVDAAFRVAAGMARVDLVVEEPGRTPRAKRATPGILGDVDNNDQVDFFDALLVVLYSEDASLLMPNNGDISRGDVNADGRVDRADARLIAASFNNASALTQSVEGDREALVALYDATDGPNWTDKTNWLSDRPLGEWHGVTTDDEGRVTELNFYLNKLTGAIPSALGNLSNLQRLYLWDNELSGMIPSALGNLSNLQQLNLWGNPLSGALPSSLGNLSNLQSLGLSNTQLCAPTDAAFQAWLGGVGSKSGVVNCMAPSPTGMCWWRCTTRRMAPTGPTRATG